MLVTISRMYGSGGSEVAQRVASALGWELIDNEFVDKVAERLGMAPSVVAEHEERVPSLGERIVKALSLSAPETARTTAELPAVSTEEAIVDVTRRVIDDAVRGGNAVLV